MGSERRHAAVGGDANSPPTAGSMMRAIVADAHGSADVLRLARITPPEIADNEALPRRGPSAIIT